MMWQPPHTQHSLSLNEKDSTSAVTSAGVTSAAAALIIALVGTSFGGLGYFCGLRLQSYELPRRTISTFTDLGDALPPFQRHRLEDAAPSVEVEAIGSPLVEGSRPLWQMLHADSYGAKTGDLGASLLYYTLAYIQKPKTCVVIGAGSGFVPALIRRGQAASGMSNGRTYVIDLGYGEDPSQSLHDPDSDFRHAFPEVEVLTIPSVPDGVLHFLDRGVYINYLHIEGNNTFDHQGAYRDLMAYKPLLAMNAVVTIHVTTAAASAQHSGAYHLVEGLKHDPCWEVTDFKPPEVSSKRKKGSQYGVGTAVVKHRCHPGRQQLAEHPLSCKADKRLMMPACRLCIPGVLQTQMGACEDDWTSPKLQYLRQRLSNPDLDWRYRDIQFSPLREKLLERQMFATVYLEKTRPRRVLDLLSGKLTLENFANFGSNWCPELILSVDVDLDPKFQTVECADGAGKVKIIHVAMPVANALADPMIHEIAFEAVLCLGCESSFDGPRAMHLESFARPYDLILEWADELEVNRAAYGHMPRSEKATEIFSFQWFHEDVSVSGDPSNLQNTTRQFRVIQYPAFT